MCAALTMLGAAGVHASTHKREHEDHGARAVQSATQPSSQTGTQSLRYQASHSGHTTGIRGILETWIASVCSDCFEWQSYVQSGHSGESRTDPDPLNPLASNADATAGGSAGLATLTAAADGIVYTDPSWALTTDGNWSVDTNWNPVGLPGPTDDVVIDVSSAAVTVTHNTGNDVIHALTVAGDDTLALSGGASTSLTVNGLASIANLDMGYTTLTLNDTSTIGTLTQTDGQIDGTGNVSVTGTATISYGSYSGTGATAVQGTTTIGTSGLQLDGGRVFRNEGTLTQNGGVDMNRRRIGTAEAGNGSVVNAVGATWDVSPSAGTNYISASSQGTGDSGAGATFTNEGTFNKQGAGNTQISTIFDNTATGALNVQQALLQFALGGTLTQSGTLTIDAGATLNLASNQSFTQTINTAPTVNGTLQIGGANYVDVTTPMAIGGTGTFQQNDGQLIGSDLTFGPDLTVNITYGGQSGAATTTVQGTTTISNSGLSLDGGRVFRNEGTLTQSGTGGVDMNYRRTGTAESGTGSVVNAAGAIWNDSLSGGANYISATYQSSGDTGAGATFTNDGTFNKQGAGTTSIQTMFDNTGTLNVQGGLLSFDSGGVLTQSGTLTIDSGATLSLASNQNFTQTLNAAPTVNGTLQIGGANVIDVTTPMAIGGTGTFQQNDGQLIGSDLTFGPDLTVNITYGGQSGAATTTVQGTTTISSSGLQLDGGREFRNEGTLTQSGTGSVDMNKRRTGMVEAGTGSVVNAAGAIWNDSLTGGANYIFASNQNTTDTGAGATFTNDGTFNKQGAGTTSIRTIFDNTGTLNAQGGLLSFDSGGVLTQSGTLTIDSGATLSLASNQNFTQTLNAVPTVNGTLSIDGANYVDITTPMTVGGTGAFEQNDGQLIGSNLTLGPNLAVDITYGAQSGAATTTVQGTTTISSSGLQLDGGRVFRNEGTLTQSGSGSIDMNNRRTGMVEAGTGNVVNAAGAAWNVSITGGLNYIFASNQGTGDTGASATFTNDGTFNKQDAGSTSIRTIFDNTGTLNVQGGLLSFDTGGALTQSGTLTIDPGATLSLSSYSLTTQTINMAPTVNGTLLINNDNYIDITTPMTIGGTGTFQENYGQLIGSDLTLGPDLAVNITDGAQSGAATTTVQGTTTISAAGLLLDGGRVFLNEGTLTQSGSGSVDMNNRRTGTVEAGTGNVVNATGATWNVSLTGGLNYIFASNQGTGDTGASATFTNDGSFNKQGAGATTVRTIFDNSATGTLNVQQGTLSIDSGGTLNQSGTLTIDSGATLALASSSAYTQTINAPPTVHGTLLISGDNYVDITTPMTIGGTGTFQENYGQLIGSDLTLGPDLAVNITYGAQSGAATTTVQGTTTISGSGLLLDGRRVFRNEGMVTQSGNVNMNARRSGSAESGTGNVVNAAGATWNTSIASGLNYIQSSNQTYDVGTGATFTNEGTFNKQGAGTTTVRTNFDNSATGTLNVQEGTLSFDTGGTLTQSGILTIDAGATLILTSANAYTQTINAAPTINGTLIISNNNLVDITTPMTIGGTGTFQQDAGQLIGSGLTLSPDLAVNITYGAQSGAATTTVQGATTISGFGLLLDGGRVFRNEGTVTQSGGINMNARRTGSAEAGNGTVVNAATWNANVALNTTNYITSGSQGTGDTGAGATFTNEGTFNKQGAGTTQVLTNFSNSGLIDAQQGLLLFNQGTDGTGTLQTSGGNVILSANSTTGNLFHNTNAANSLSLGTNTITVSNDYNNANFGVGNSFDRRANVSATGTTPQILAAGDVDQAISGADVTGGATATPSIVVGNVHVGSTTYNYNIDNTGTTGPVLRGAIQDAVNGGNITDARLSGNGVVAGNWGPVATGASLSRDVTVTINTAGVYAPISGQAVSIINNFENTRSQVLTITSASGAAAYNLAAADTVSPNPVELGNQRVGGTATGSLTIANVAPSGSYTEGLDASFGTTTGAALTNGGSVSLLAGVASDSSAMAVGLNGTTAGAQTGTVQVNFASNGSGTSELGITGLASQTVTVNGAFFNAAVGSTAPDPVVLGNQRIGGTGSQALTVSNTAAAGAFSEALNASFGTNAGSATNNAGAVTDLIAGGSNAVAMSVGVDTTTAGAKTGSVTLNYQTDGTGANGNSGLAAISAGSQTINVSGNVYQVAAGQLNTAPLNFGTVQVGQAVSQTLSISNIATGPTGYVEDLNARFGTTSGTNGSLISGTGEIAGLLAGGADASAMTVTVDTSGAATVNGSIAVNFYSAGAVNGTSNGLGELGVGSADYGVAGTIETVANVIDQAAPVINTPTIALGNVRVGATSPTDFVSVTNQATGNQQAALNASISTTAPLTASGSFNLLAPGATDSTSLQVGMDTSTAGSRNGIATVAFVSDASNVGGCAPNCQLTLTSQNVNVTGGVYNVAVGSTAPDPVVLGNQRIGGTASQALTVSNTAAAGAFSEALNAGFGTNTGSATNNAGAVTDLIAGGSNAAAMSVGVDTTTAGAKTGSVTLNYQTDGTGANGNSGLAAISAGSQTINVSGNVYRMAAGATTPTPIDFGNVRVNDTASQALTVTNTAANDGFSENLNASFTGSSGSTTVTSGSVTGLSAQSSDNSSMSVALDTTAAGGKSGSVTIGYVSTGVGTSGLADIGNGNQTINFTGGVYQVAQPSVPTTVNLGNVHTGGNLSQAITIGNTNVAPSGYQEGLDVAVGGTTGGATGTGSITNLAAGSTSTAVNVGLNGIAAGAQSGTVTLNLASNGATTSGLGVLGLGSTDVTVNATGYDLAAGSVTPTPVTLGNQRVGGSLTQALTVANTAPTSTYTETLSASFGSNTGNATNNGGTVSGIAGGSSDNAALAVGVDTSAAGARTGTVSVNLSSNEVNGSGLGVTAFVPQTINVSGNVYQVAAGQLNTAPLNFGTVQVGQAVSQTLSISNVATGPTGYVEDLNARFGTTSGTNGSLISGTGEIAGLLAGGTDASAMTVTVDTSGAATVNGSIAVNFYSAGAVNGTSNGLGELGVGSADYGVAGTIETVANVIDQAAPVINTPTIALGNVRVGATSPTDFVSVTNQATGNQQAALNASISTTAPLTASGSFNLLAPGATDSTSLQVGMDTSTAGSRNGIATVAFVSDASNVGGCAPNCQLTLSSQNVNVTGAVYRLADPTITSGPITLAARVGDSAPSAAIGVTNVSPDQYTESLNASLASTPTGFTGSGAINGLVAGASSSALGVALDTTTSGSFSGNAEVAFASSGAGTTGAADYDLGSQSVAVSGNVYQAAVASVTPTIDFGTVRIGSTVAAQTVSVANVASGALTDVLREQSRSVSAPFALNGTVGDVVAGDSANLSASMSTAAAGVYNGTATLNLSSHNGEMQDLALGAQTVILTGQVNNLADAIFEGLGGLGTLSGSGTQYQLDFGNIVLTDLGGLVGQSTQLGVRNAATGPADNLAGTFSDFNTGIFTLNGFDDFSGLAAGLLLQGLAVSIDTTQIAQLGEYMGSVLLNPFDTLTGFDDLRLDPITLALRINVIQQSTSVPEPPALLLLLTGLVILYAARRRRRQR